MDEVKDNEPVKVDIYTGDTYEYVRTFNSMNEAAKWMGAAASGVWRSLYKGYRVQGYLVMKHGEKPVIPEPKQNQIEMSIYAVYNQANNKLLGIYLTQSDVAKAFNISKQCVNRAVKCNKPTKGLVIKVEQKLM